MFGNTSMESSARELLSKEWSERDTASNELRASNRSAPSARHGRHDSDDRTMSVLPRLVDLVAEMPDQPVQNLAPVIQRVLCERTFVEDGEGMTDQAAAN